MVIHSLIFTRSSTHTSDMHNKDAAILVLSSLGAACMGVAGGDLANGAFLFGWSVDDPASAVGGLVLHGTNRNNAHSQNVRTLLLKDVGTVLHNGGPAVHSESNAVE